MPIQSFIHDDARSADIRAMEARRCKAMLDGDTHTLRELFDEGLVYAHSTGGRDTRASYLAKLDEGAMRYEAVVLDVEEVQVRDRFALLCGSMTASVTTPNGTVAVASRYEAVWMWSIDTWRMVALQSFARS